MWRLARPEEDPVVTELWQALNREDPAEAPPPPQNLVRTLDALRKHPERGCVAVLELNHAIVGYALLISFWDNEQGGLLCVVDELYVVPAQRGVGHATALLQSLSQGCAMWPNPPAGIELEVSPSNAKAYKLYERLGFRVNRNIGMRRIGPPGIF